MEISALQFLPSRITMSDLREAAQGCQGCPLFANATQTVFGEGKLTARIMLIGEQPGNDEDLQGHPFVGPAGRVLDQGLMAAGIDRDDAYVTNVVKHFKWVSQGRRRIHKKPSVGEIGACLPWLDKEIELVQPEVMVCLGTTAAQALLGKDFKVSERRGQPLACKWARHVLATVHPSSILRQPTSDAREREIWRFAEDLKVAANLLDGIL